MQNAERRTPKADVERETQTAGVRDYWNRWHDAYLESVGTTFQAGRMGGGSFRESNGWLARAARFVADAAVAQGPPTPSPPTPIASPDSNAKRRC